MQYVLIAALAAFLVPGSSQVSINAGVRAEREATLPGHETSHPGREILAQGIPGAVYKSSQPRVGSGARDNLA